MKLKTKNKTNQEEKKHLQFGSITKLLISYKTYSSFPSTKFYLLDYLFVCSFIYKQKLMSRKVHAILITVFGIALIVPEISISIGFSSEEN